MPDARFPTVDQIRVFLAVVDQGSFAAAARHLGRATSVISYAVANFETQLGVELFDRRSTRKPLMTEAGRAVLADARGIAEGLDGLLARSQGLREGLEAEVSLVVDVMLPACTLVEALMAFQDEFPTVTLRLQVEALGAVVQHVLEGRAHVGISGPALDNRGGVERRLAGSIRLVPVAAPSHPLSAARAPHALATLRDHLQLVLTDRSPLTEGRDFGVVAGRTWRLADLGAKHALLLAGIGWGSMPEPMVRADIAAGRLVRLAIEDWDDVHYRLEAIHLTKSPPGPAGRWLIERLKSADWEA